MRRVWAALMLVVVLTACVARGQEDVMSLDEMVQSADQWAKENLDDDALRALEGVDREKVKQFLKELQKELGGEYVLDLAQLRETARTMVPVLDAYHETTPYAVWLKAHLDYFDVAEQFRQTIKPPQVKPGQPPKPAPNPTPQLEREVWIKELGDRPWPKAAQPYVSRLKPIFTAEKVPPELVWIAEVESSFDPRACSPAGAVGLFQLRPATAKRYGLRTGFFDQRRKPEESARAAAKYLRFLKGEFKDWRLALAAYNAGEGTVRTLLKRHKATTFDGIAARLPAETQMFVPRVEAVVLRREGIKLQNL